MTTFFYGARPYGVLMEQGETRIADNWTVSQSVVKAIAEAKDVKPRKLTPPLCEVIDPDALEKLFAHKSATGKVVFNYNSCEVSVFSDGYISVEKRYE